MSPDPLDDTRQRLLTAAGEIFASVGFKGATTRDICGRAAANGAAINYYFRDKQGLYQAAVEAAHGCSPELANPHWPTSFTTADKLRTYVSKFLSQLLDPERPAWHARLMLREMAEPTDACVLLVEAYIRPMAMTLRAILDDSLPARLTESQRWMVGFSIVSQCLFYKTNRAVAKLLVGSADFNDFQVEHIADHIARFSLAALGLAPSAFRDSPAEAKR